jgi:hypothetical protein
VRRGLLVVLVPLACAGCGGDEESVPLSRGDYIARADRICSAAAREFDKVQFDDGASWAALRRDSHALVVIADRAIGDLRALSPPPGDEETIDRLLELIEADFESQKRLRDAIRARDRARAFAVLNEQTNIKKRRALARRYGMRVCDDFGNVS